MHQKTVGRQLRCGINVPFIIGDSHAYRQLQIRSTWEGEREAFSANMLKAVALIISVFEDNLNDEHFKSKLSKVSAREISRAAEDSRNRTSGYADAVMTYCNKRMKVPLKSDKITSKLAIYSLADIKEYMKET